MLYKYKDDYRKVAMGLLSFIPELKEIPHLKKELAWYDADEHRNLFLWKNDNGNFSAVIGAETNPDNRTIMVRRVAVTPNEPQSVQFQMLTALANRFPEYKVMGNFATSGLITAWEKQTNE